MSAVLAHLDGERGRRAQLVSAVVEMEKVVEEVMRAVPWKALLKKINVHAKLPSGAGDRRPDLDAEAAAAVIHAYKDSSIHPEETTRSEGARLLTHRHTSAMCECAKQVKCNNMWDRKKVGSHSLAPVHCDSCTITDD